MARTMIAPIAVEYQLVLADTINAVKSVDKNLPQTAVKKLLEDTCGQTERALTAIKKLETCVNEKLSSDKLIRAMEELRAPIDKLESLLPHEIWPLPSYAEMMFVI